MFTHICWHSLRFLLRGLVCFIIIFTAGPRQAVAQTNPQLPQGSTQVIYATQVGQPVSPSWSVTLNDRTIATSKMQNGWFVSGSQSVLLGHTVYKIGLLIPANATAAPNYSVHVNVIAIPSFSISANFTVAGNSLQLIPPTIIGNQSSTGIITLATPAPNGGLTISLASSQPSASVPSTIMAASGTTAISFPITTTSVINKTIVEISAKFSKTSLSANLIQLPNSFPYDNPPPTWATGVVPRDTAAVGDFGPSAADTVNLASGVLESAPSPDAVAYNSVGPSAVFSRLYRSANAAKGYGSPGLSPGWTHNFDVTALSGTGEWLPVILKYPDGATETWSPQVNGNGLPTGVFSLPRGTPYLATGQPDPLIPGHWLSLTMTFKDHSTWTLSPAAGNNTNYQLAQITNLVGHSLTIQYDINQNVTAVVNDAQPPVPLLSFNYNGGYLSSITDAYGRTVTYTFASVGGTGSNLTDVSQINSNVDQWHYTYTNANNWILLANSAQPDPTSNGNGSTMLSNTITYGTDGRVASLTDANNNVHTYSYNIGPTAISFRGPQSSGNDPNYQQLFGSLNNMTGTVDAANKSDQVQYTDINNPFCPTSYVNRNGQISTATYDAYGNPLEIQTPLINDTLTTTYIYDYSTFPIGNLAGISISNAGGAYGVGYTYYPNGLVQAVNTPDPSGATQFVSVVTTYTALGNVATISVPAANQSGNNVTYTYNYVTDSLDGTTQAESLGEPLTVTDPNGNITHFRWDNRGNLTAVIDGMGNKWQYFYNLADQLYNIQAPVNGTGQLQISTKYLYLNGPATKVILNDTNGVAFRTTSVALGKEGEDLADQGNTEQATYLYDDTLRLKGLTDADGNAYTHTYNNVDDLTQLQFPGGMAQLQYNYDADHNLKTFTNARNQQTIFNLALDGSPTSYTRSDGTQVSAIYDWAGRVKELSDAQTILSYAYNGAGLLMTETTNYLANKGIPDTEVDYYYNCDGSINNISTVWGSYLYTYDNGGRLTDITFPSQRRVHYDYDQANRLTHQGLTDFDTYYQYNALNQLTQQTVKSSSFGVTATLNQYTDFSYDAAGNLLGYTWKCPQLDYISTPFKFSDAFSFTYDSFEHLIHETSQGNLTGFGATYNTSYDWSHQSDAADNLTELRNINFSGNVLDQVTLDSNINDANAYQYDADGNATTYHGSPCVYDTENHLISYTYSGLPGPGQPLQVGPTTTTFGYRPDGRIAWRIDPYDPNGNKLYYLYIGGRVFHQYNLGIGSSRTYDWGVTGLTEVESTDDPRYSSGDFVTSYSYDPLGSVCGRVLSNGVPASRFNTVSLYDAFGWARGAWSGTSLNFSPLITTGDTVGWGGAWGAETIVEPGGGLYGPGYVGVGTSGLMLLGYRFYSPDTGRFLTRDPLSYGGGINLYAYTRNNPVMHADASGLTQGWDVFFVAWDMFNIADDVINHRSNAAIASDVGALCIDGVLLMIPGAPSGPGHMMMAGGRTVALATSTTAHAEAAIRAGQMSIHVGATLAHFMAGESKERRNTKNLPDEELSERGRRMRQNNKMSNDVCKAMNELFKGMEQHSMQTSFGKRRFDLFNVTDSVGAEVKVGRVGNGKHARGQIAKDAELLKSGMVGSITWHFFPSSVTLSVGPSPALRKALEKEGIKIVIH